jgi:hypothetical protein
MTDNLVRSLDRFKDKMKFKIEEKMKLRDLDICNRRSKSSPLFQPKFLNLPVYTFHNLTNSQQMDSTGEKKINPAVYDTTDIYGYERSNGKRRIETR